MIFANLDAICLGIGAWSQGYSPRMRFPAVDAVRSSCLHDIIPGSIRQFLPYRIQQETGK